MNYFNKSIWNNWRRPSPEHRRGSCLLYYMWRIITNLQDQDPHVDFHRQLINTVKSKQLRSRTNGLDVEKLEMMLTLSDQNPMLILSIHGSFMFRHNNISAKQEMVEVNKLKRFVFFIIVFIIVFHYCFQLKGRYDLLLCKNLFQFLQQN